MTMNVDTCSFFYNRPESFGGRRHEIGAGCQFKEESEFYEYSGKSWCSFHLPLDAKLSGQYTDEELLQMDDKVDAVISASINHSRLIDLCGITYTRSLMLSELVEENSVQDILFTGSEWGASIFLGDVNYRGRIWFDRCTVHGDFSLTDTTIRDALDFEQLAVEGDVWFSRSRFENLLRLRRGVFQGNLSCEEAFFNRIYASYLSVFKEANFRRSDFNKAVFINSRFCGEANFRNAMFRERSTFKLATFHGKADFSRSARTGAGADEVSLEFPRMYFRQAKFLERFRILNRKFGEPADFRGGYFVYPPESFGCDLHPGTNFSDATFFLSKSNERIDCPACFRDLRLKMENNRDRLMEGTFFALEQKTRRLDGSMPAWDSFVSYLYELGSLYGQSTIRSILWIGVLGVFFGFLYSQNLYFSETGFSADSSEVTRFTLRQMFLPFSVFREPNLSNRPIILLLFSGLHGVLNITLLALFVMALRRRFKIH